MCSRLPWEMAEVATPTTLITETLTFRFPHKFSVPSRPVTFHQPPFSSVDFPADLDTNAPATLAPSSDQYRHPETSWRSIVMDSLQPEQHENESMFNRWLNEVLLMFPAQFRDTSKAYTSALAVLVHTKQRFRPVFEEELYKYNVRH
jgi:hypothetical protein